MSSSQILSATSSSENYYIFLENSNKSWKVKNVKILITGNSFKLKKISKIFTFTSGSNMMSSESSTKVFIIASETKSNIWIRKLKLLLTVKTVLKIKRFIKKISGNMLKLFMSLVFLVNLSQNLKKESTMSTYNEFWTALTSKMSFNLTKMEWFLTSITTTRSLRGARLIS